MATLTENVARVTSALDDIKNAIIDKGVTPTGKCETFAAAIESIPSGGSVKSGNFTTVAGDGSFIECGFVPTRISVNSFYLAAASTESSDYFDGDFNEIYRTSGGTTFIMTNNRIFPGTENGKMGFRYKARYAGKVAHFIATK